MVFILIENYLPFEMSICFPYCCVLYKQYWCSFARAGAWFENCRQAETNNKTRSNEWFYLLVYKKKYGEIADQQLIGKYLDKELERVILVRHICVQNEAEKRPTMSEVMDMLMNNLRRKWVILKVSRSSTYTIEVKSIDEIKKFYPQINIIRKRTRID